MDELLRKSLEDINDELNWRQYIIETSYERLNIVYNNIQDDLTRLKLENILNLLGEV